MCANRNISISRLSICSQKEIVIAPPASHAFGLEDDRETSWLKKRPGLRTSTIFCFYNISLR